MYSTGALADALIKEGKTDILGQNLRRFKKNAFNISVAAELSDAGYGKEVLNNPHLFNEVEMGDLEFVAEHGTAGLTKKMIELRRRIEEHRDLDYVAEQLPSFGNGALSMEIAGELVKAGYGDRVSKYHSIFKGKAIELKFLARFGYDTFMISYPKLSKPEVAMKLIEKGESEFISKIFQTVFKDVERRGLARKMMEIGRADTLAENLRHFEEEFTRTFRC